MPCVTGALDRNFKVRNSYVVLVWKPVTVGRNLRETESIHSDKKGVSGALAPHNSRTIVWSQSAVLYNMEGKE
jgi:hypothetical protein